MITKNSTETEVLAALSDPNKLEAAKLFIHVSPEILKSEPFLKKAVSINGFILPLLPKELTTGRDFVHLALPSLIAFDLSPFALKLMDYMGFKVIAALVNLQNLDLISYLLQLNSQWFCISANWISSKNPIFNNAEVMLRAISYWPEAYNYASEHLKNDDRFILKAIGTNPDVFKFLISGKKTIRLYHLAAISKDFSNYKKLPTNFKKDNFFDHDALDVNPAIFSLLSEELQKNPTFIKLALEEKRALVAIKKDANNFKLLKIELQTKESFIIKAIKVNPEFLVFLNEQMQDNENIFLAAVENDVNLLKFASKKIQESKRFALAVFKKDHSKYKECLARVSNKKGFFAEVSKLIPADSFTELYLKSESQHSSKEFIHEALNLAPTPEDTWSIFLLNPFKSDKEMVLKFLELLPKDKSGYAYTSSGPLMKDEDVALATIKKDPKNYDTILDHGLKTTPQFMAKAALQTPEVQLYFSKKKNSVILPEPETLKETNAEDATSVQPSNQNIKPYLKANNLATIPIIMAVKNAKQAYSNWFFGKASGEPSLDDSFNRVTPGRSFSIFFTEGKLTWFRHRSSGQERASKFLLKISNPKKIEADLWQDIKELLLDIETAYHCHSFISFLLDELSRLKGSPFFGIKPISVNHRYTREQVVTILEQEPSFFPKM